MEIHHIKSNNIKKLTNQKVTDLINYVDVKYLEYVL
jgi:hypothetical protein